MNNLQRVINPGERVVVAKNVHLPQFQELNNRIFIAETGNGMAPFTAGSKIFGHYESDGEETFIRGWDIDVEETNGLGVPHGSG